MIRERSERAGNAEREDVVLARARARAKSAWAAAQREDDRTRKVASEERLVASWPRPRVLPVRSFVLGAAAAAAVVLAALAAVQGARARSESGAVTTAAPWMPAAGASAASAPEIVTPASLPSARVVPRGIVFADACPECRVGGAAIEPGMSFGVGAAVSVPRGTRLTLGFALPGSVVDPSSGVDLEGPAAASVPDDQSLSLDRGSARFRGLRDVELSVPGARVIAEGATFTVRIDARGVARIAVEKGHVIVTSLGTKKVQSIDAGDAFEVAVPTPAQPTTVATPSAAPSSPTPSPTEARPAGDPVATARARFHDGDSAAARTQLEALIQSPDVTVSRRASFTLAEIEMATNDRERGRARLTDLLSTADVRLAADAATLLARSDRTAAARAETWARYLATSRPTDYRERALLERAEALFDANRPREANALLSELRTLPLSDPHKRQLDRLTYKTRETR